MSEVKETKPENAEEQKPTQRRFNPIEAAETLAEGVYALKKPIQDGEKTYEALNYDFNALTAWELARAIDQGTNGRNDAFAMTDTQALSLFAAAAAKATPGLDATDIRERLSAADGLAAIRVASIFFNGSSLAGSLRFTKESSKPAD